jgi:hypothetical protein
MNFIDIEKIIQIEVPCQLCGQPYTIKELFKVTREHGKNNTNYQDHGFFDLEEQLNMEICGPCRIERAPCFGCDGCWSDSMCPNCVFYGLNNKDSRNGWCVHCYTYNH